MKENRSKSEIEADGDLEDIAKAIKSYGVLILFIILCSLTLFALC